MSGQGVRTRSSSFQQARRLGVFGRGWHRHANTKDAQVRVLDSIRSGGSGDNCGARARLRRRSGRSSRGEHNLHALVHCGTARQLSLAVLDRLLERPFIRYSPLSPVRAGTLEVNLRVRYFLDRYFVIDCYFFTPRRRSWLECSAVEHDQQGNKHAPREKKLAEQWLAEQCLPINGPESELSKLKRGYISVWQFSALLVRFSDCLGGLISRY